MKTNQEITAIANENLSAQQIADYCKYEISGKKASHSDVQKVSDNIVKFYDLGWNNYNGFAPSKSNEDKALDIFESL